MKQKLLIFITLLAFTSSKAQTFISNLETSFGSNKADFLTDIKKANNGSVVTTGFFCSTVDFDPGSGVYNLTSNGTTLTVNTSYGANQFVQKFNTSGALMWAIANVTGEFQNLSTQIVPEVDVDAAGNVFVSTKVHDSLDVDPGPSVLNMPAPRISNTGMGMIQKLDATTGALLWAIPVDADFKMQVDNNGDVLIAGSYGDSVDLDPGSGTFWMDPLANNSTAPFAAKYSGVDGSFMWGADFDFASTYTIIRDIDVSSSNRLMLCGSFRNTIDVNPDPTITSIYNGNANYNQGFMIMLNADGTFYTARDYSYNNGSNWSTNSFSCAFDDLDNYYVSTTVPSSSSPVNAFIKYSPSNYAQWTEDLGTSIYSMECKGDGEIYLEGRIGIGIPDIDPSSNIVAPNNSTISHLIMKWDGSSNNPSSIGGPTLDWYKVIDEDFQNFNRERFYMDVDDNDGLYIAATYADNLTPNLGSTNTYSVVTCNPNQPSFCYDMYLNFAQICESTTTYDTAWICAGLDYTFPNGSIQTINAATDYTSSLQSSAGCDSIIETHVALDIEMAISALFNNCVYNYNQIRVIVTDMGTVNGQISPAFDMMIDGTTINIAGPGTYYFITSIDDASYRAFIFSNNCHPDITVYNNCYQPPAASTGYWQRVPNSSFENTVTVGWTEFATFLDSTTNTGNSVITGSNGGTYNDSPLSAWLGGWNQGSYSAISNTVFLQLNSTAELSWYQRQTGNCAIDDILEVRIDGTTIYSQSADQDLSCNGSTMWTLKKLDLTAYNDGSLHELMFFYTQQGTNGLSNLFIDEVHVYDIPCPTIPITYDTAYVCIGDNYTYPDGNTLQINSSTTYNSSLMSTIGCDSIVQSTAIIETVPTLTAEVSCNSNEVVVTVTDMGTFEGNPSPPFDIIDLGSSQTATISGVGTYTLPISDNMLSGRIGLIEPNNCAADIDYYNTCDQTICSGSESSNLLNGDFENGSTNWTQFEAYLDSSSSGSLPISTPGGNGTFDNSTTSAWFGGWNQGSYNSISQDVIIDAGSSATLEWWQRQTNGCAADDVLTVLIDGDTLFELHADQDPHCGVFGATPWNFKSVDVSAYTDGMSHNVMFHYTQLGSNDYTNLFIDNINLYTCPCPVVTISFNDTICFFDSYTFPDGNTFTWQDLPEDTVYVSALDLGNGCDSLVYTNLHKRPNSVGPVQFPNVCFGSNHTYPDGFMHTNIQSNLGHASVLTNQFGCDSNQLQILQVQPVYLFFDTTILCAGADYTAPDGTIYPNVQATFNHTSNLSTAYGCDSTHQFRVEVLPSYTVSSVDTICYNGSYTFPDGNTLNNLQEDTLYVIPNTAQNGCDSSIILDLFVRPNSQGANSNHTVCSGDDFTFADGVVEMNITSNVVHLNTFTNQYGCDSTFIQFINTVNPVYNFNDTIDLCYGTNYTALDGTFYGNVQADFIHTSSYTTINGCDSIYEAVIQVLPHYVNSSVDTICYNESYTFPDGNTLNNLQADTLYVVPLVTVNGCDSSISVDLVVRDENVVADLNHDLCVGADFTYLDGTQALNVQASESHTNIYTDIYGCDSTITENLLINPIAVVVDSFDVCYGDDFTFADGTVLTISNDFVYTSNLSGGAGCDSTVETSINVIGIGGTILSSTAQPLANSKVYLIEHLPGQDFLFLQDSTTTNANGEYHFDEGEPNHFIKAIPSGSFSTDFPTYYLASAVFQYGLEVDCDEQLDFTTIAGQNLGGSGFISGYIGNGSGKNSEIGEPIIGLAIVLTDNFGNVIARTITDNEGYFIFENLICGSYQIWVDDALTDNNLAPLISLDANCIEEDLLLKLENNKLEIQNATSIETDYNSLNVKVYPNPTSSLFTIEINNLKEQFNIEITNTLGQLIYTEPSIKEEKIISTNNWSNGIYHISFKSETGEFLGYKKIVVSK